MTRGAPRPGESTHTEEGAMKISTQDALACMKEVNELSAKMIEKLAKMKGDEIETGASVGRGVELPPQLPGFFPAGRCFVRFPENGGADPDRPDKLAGAFALIAKVLKV